jgi:hypothetical protein
MTDFDYGLAGRRTAWPVASPAEMFWPDILSPVSHLEGDREFADSALEGDGFELPVREHRAMAPSHGFAAASHREAALCGAPASMARPRSEAQRGSARPAAMRSAHREIRPGENVTLQ